MKKKFKEKNEVKKFGKIQNLGKKLSGKKIRPINIKLKQKKIGRKKFG